MRLTEIELALDPAPRLILQLAAAPQFVYAPPLSSNQIKLDLIALLRAFSMAIIALACEFRELEPVCIVGAERLNGLLNEIAFGGFVAHSAPGGTSYSSDRYQLQNQGAVTESVAAAGIRFRGDTVSSNVEWLCACGRR